MTESAQYTPEELKAMREVFVTGTMPECPRCHIHMTERPIGGGSFGLGYARKREWLICPRCRRSAIYDIRRGTRN
ncbi:MAG: hypothetical protein ACM31F_06780 [Gemmatimonas sp.]|jgi:hypothetical protein|nr:hypothetical protein [Gemmatimonadaceae bacterium]